MRSTHLAALARLTALSILVAIVAAPAALAITDQRPAGRFDDRIRPMHGGTIVDFPRTVESLETGDGLKGAWDEFRSRYGGAWEVYLDDRTGMPALVAGKGIDWLPAESRATADLASLEANAREFLATHPELLGETGNIELDLTASKELRPGHWQLIFRQAADGVRVENARLDLHVVNGRLAMFGASHWGPLRMSGRPAVGADIARAALDAYLGVLTIGFKQVEEPELTLIAVDADPAAGEPQLWNGERGEGLEHVLVWRFRFSEPREAPLWIGEIDAHDGSVRAFYDGTHYGKVTGGVFPISPDGNCSEGGCEVVGFPMPFADFTESGQLEEYADEFGNMQCGDPQASFETNLAGPYVLVTDTCGGITEWGTCDDGLDLGQKLGENCDVEPGASPGNSAASRSGYYHINRIAEVARFYDPGNAWLEGQVELKVNLNGSCNAFWNGDINMNGQGGNCGNTGEMQGILVHEWGHGYDHNDGGGVDVTGEAYADVVALLAARDSCISPGFRLAGATCDGYGNTCLNCTGLREHDWAEHAWNQPSTAANFVITQCPPDWSFGGPCNREPHCEASLIAESMYDLVARDLPAAGVDPATAWQIGERLFYETRPGSGGDMYFCYLPNTHSCGATSMYQRMRVADDDDGDLSNGTPHAAELFAAFKRHALACGAVDDPENQSTSSCPSLATPTLSAIETAGGTELSWGAVAGAVEYRAYRGDLGCDRGFVPIASLTGGETTFVDDVADQDFPRHYRIDAFGTNHACQTAVSNCVSTPLSARLQMNGHRVVETGPLANGSGTPDPGETVRLPVTLFNTGLDDAIAVTGDIRLLDSTQGRLLEPQASWGNLAPSQAAEPSGVNFELALLEETSCGETLRFEVDYVAANATPGTRGLEIPLGVPQRDFTEFVNTPVPNETTVPVTAEIVVSDAKTIAELDVAIDINTSFPEELIVELTSPGGTTVRLHDQTVPPFGSGIDLRYDLDVPVAGPGSMSDFIGEPTDGTWTLSVEDVGTASTVESTIWDWTLHMTVSDGFDCEQLVCADPPLAAASGLVVDRAFNGPDIDLSFSWSAVAGAAGYNLLQSPAAAFDTAVELTGRTTTATTLNVANGANTTPPVTFFQVRGINSCNQEGP